MMAYGKLSVRQEYGLPVNKAGLPQERIHHRGRIQLQPPTLDLSLCRYRQLQMRLIV